MSVYSSPVWQDVLPLPLDQPPESLCQIAYPPAYVEATAFLRAIMASGEMSPRVLELTSHVLRMNPGSYATWLYRAKTLLELKLDLHQEIEWLNVMSIRFEKNYQIWNHRQILIDAIGSPDGERDFISKMFMSDAKNYHVWSYRVWLVRRFNLWDTELPYLNELIDRDVRNNSAWSHRFFVQFQRDGVQPSELTLKDEIEYAAAKIELAPQNASPWNYLRGALKAVSHPITDLRALCLKYAPIETHGEVTSSHALDILASIYAAEEDNEMARKALGMLSETYDPIRKGYWRWRESLLGRRTLSREATLRPEGEATIVPVVGALEELKVEES